MKKTILLFVVCFVSISLAQEFPVTSNPGVFYNYNPSIFDTEEINFQPLNLPAWSTLERMELSERNNSLLEIEVESGNATTEIFKNITALWNTGKYADALDLFKTIDNEKLKNVSVGINWKVPVQTNDQADWETDVRIGNRDSIETVSLAFEKSTGNLFAVLLYQESGSYFWSVNLSTDGGTTWTETFTWFSSLKIMSADAVVVGSYCYVGYASATNNLTGRLRRFNTSDGTSASFPDGFPNLNVFTLAATDSVKQVVVNSNQNDFNNRLYYAAITNSDSIKIFWNDPTTVIYNEYLNTITDGNRGLDLSWNNGSTGLNYNYYLVISYLTSANAIKILGVASNDSIQLLNTYGTGFGYEHSSISAHNDTITSVFEYGNHNRYLVSYNGGTNWFFGLVGDTLVTSEAPDIAAGDGGVGIIYRYYTPTREGRFIWRPMAGLWSTPVKYTDHEPYYNKPAIEYLGNKKFGVIYLSWVNPAIRGAYFDLNNMLVDVNDELSKTPSNFNLSQNYPNPFNPSTLIRYQIPSQNFVSIKIYDALGNLIQDLVGEDKAAGSYELEFNASKLASGVYFYRIQAGSFVQTKKMMLVR